MQSQRSSPAPLGHQYQMMPLEEVLSWNDLPSVSHNVVILALLTCTSTPMHASKQIRLSKEGL